MLVLAVISSLAAGAVFTMTNLVQRTEATKLERDAATINRAIAMYLVNGGRFADTDLGNPQSLLDKLKSRADESSRKEVAGLRQDFVDARLSFEMQTTTEAARAEPRAVFVADIRRPRFEVRSSPGPAGIRRFVLSDESGSKNYGVERRAASLKLAKREKWVWDFMDSSVASSPLDNPARTSPEPPSPEAPDVNLIRLNPPSFSIDGGNMPLTNYPLSLVLTTTNAPRTSQILYSINGRPFAPYVVPLAIDPGMTVSAVSATLDPDRYSDSESVSEAYTTTPVTPRIFVLFTRSSYTYFELGGASAPGSPAGAPQSVNGFGLLLNAGQIPVAYQNSSIFRFHWTFDGSNPLTSSTAVAAPDFSGGFQAATIPLPLSAFNAAGVATVRVAVRTANPAILTNSAIDQRSLTASPLKLPVPIIDFANRDAGIRADVATGRIPAGARIFYTTDGKDPEDNAGEPRRGTLYGSQPIYLDGSTGSTFNLRARLYPPSAHKAFFVTSEMASGSYVLPPPSEVYVGGNFFSSSGNPLRNIARLSSGGLVDRRFDTGAGASRDSVVGVIRQSSSRVLAGGDFESVNGVARPAVVRLRSDGTVDSGFNAGLTTTP